MISEELKDLMAECYRDTRKAAKVFLPDRFWRPFDDAMHGRIFDLLDNSDNRLKVIAAPRGIGKTSILNTLLPLKAILYQDTNYIVPVSATSDLAMQQSENLKYELIQNDIVTKIYGPLASDNFSKRQWVVNPAGSEICVMPRGAGQQIRGLLFRNHRPGLILVDDLEDPEHMDSEEQRKKKSDWFFADLLNSVDRGFGADWQVIVLGTVLHQDSLLVNLLDNPDWDSVTLEICDDDLKSTAPNFMPDSAVLDLYNKYEQAGKIDVFYREYRNNPVPTGKDAIFPPHFFKYYDPAELNLDRKKGIENIVIVDPAKTTNLKSAESAIVGIGFDPATEALYVRDIVADKFHPDELYDETIDMVLRLNARILGIEVTSLHEFITYPLKNELIRRGVFVEVMELHARGGDNEKGKIKRVKSLISLYRNGLIYHNKACTKPLEAQLLSFPRPKRWDIMDALGYISEILERGGRYMVPSNAQDEEESQREIEAEYKDLEENFFDYDIDSFRIV